MVYMTVSTIALRRTELSRRADTILRFLTIFKLDFTRFISLKQKLKFTTIAETSVMIRAALE